jgi:hypothetical protein
MANLDGVPDALALAGLGVGAAFHAFVVSFGKCGCSVSVSWEQSEELFEQIGLVLEVVAWANGQEVSDGDHATPKPARTLSTRDVFVYFDNDAQVFAPKDAQALAQRVNKLLTP